MILDSHNNTSKLHLPFGPVIYSSSISDELHKFLLDETEKVCALKVNDAQCGLAGKFIYGENRAFFWDNENKNRFDNEIKNHLVSYTRWMYEINQFTKESQHALFEDMFKQTKNGAWVNIQKAGDFNPIHDHVGDISMVMYLKVPEFSEEDEYRRGGYINWTYGEHNNMWIDTYEQKPVEKAIYIFPSKLKHYVWPMQSSEDRISVACNYEIIKI